MVLPRKIRTSGRVLVGTRLATDGDRYSFVSNIGIFHSLTEIYIAESLIRDYRSTLSGDSLRISEYNEQFIADVKALLQSYRSQGRQALFVPDMKLLVDAYRTAGFSDLFIQSFEALTRSLVANGRWRNEFGTGTFRFRSGGRRKSFRTPVQVAASCFSRWPVVIPPWTPSHCSRHEFYNTTLVHSLCLLRRTCHHPSWQEKMKDAVAVQMWAVYKYKHSCVRTTSRCSRATIYSLLVFQAIYHTMERR